MEQKNEKNSLLPASILLSAIILSGAWMYTARLKFENKNPVKDEPREEIATEALEEKVLPSSGVILPVRWGDLGAKMASVGVIDEQKFESLYLGRGDPYEENKKIFQDIKEQQIRITSENSGFLLNIFWALGLGAKNDILERGPMMTYSGAHLPAEALAEAGNFASTAGWTLAKGGAMNHYSRHPFITLTTEQQKLVETVSKNIYRPCCNNPAYFPDCNHGMAMLGLLELMASQGAGEQEMYKTALKVNAFWFPDNYLTIAQYLASKGIDWDRADPKEILGANYSSASGYKKIFSQITAPPQKGGGGCGI